MPEINSGKNKAEILPIEQFLRMKDIRIPEYQRPYRWEEKNVAQLINDIFIHKDKGRYRLGTIVIHQNEIKSENKLYRDIVDGQQRFTTLRILLYALYKIVQTNPDNFETYIIDKVSELKREIDTIPISYTNKESIKQIRNNYYTAIRLLNKFDTLSIKAFIEKCEVVVFYISDITEAFQFFDSQNARGKDLYPHDLLKAFHLRAFDDKEQQKQLEIVDQWEQYESKDLANVFAIYLYRIKGWADQNSSRRFTKKDIGMFKGINIYSDHLFPYMRPIQIAHSFVDHYNSNFERNIDKQKFDYPFQLDSIMINGRRFFEYTAYYKKIIEGFKKRYEVSVWNDEMSPTQKIFYLAYHNSKSYRDGEKYLLSMFECLVIYYLDKFGYADFDYFLEKAFVWVYSLRFKYQRLGFDSVDNFVVENPNINLFHQIRKVISPEQIINIDITSIFPTELMVNSYSIEGNYRLDFRIGIFFKNKMYYAN